MQHIKPPFGMPIVMFLDPTKRKDNGGLWLEHCSQLLCCACSKTFLTDLLEDEESAEFVSSVSQLLLACS